MMTYLNLAQIKTIFFMALISTGTFVVYYIEIKKASSFKQIVNSRSVRNRSNTKYILLWTDAKTTPFEYFGEGNTVFKKKKCKFTNCHVTSNRKLLIDYSLFDIVAFNGPQLVRTLRKRDLPKYRSPRQKYVYTNIESAAWYPDCSKTFDGFFNWTWTYKLNSDAVWGYLVVRNSSYHVIGPSENMNWISLDDMQPIDDDLKNKLVTKKKAAAWFVSNCITLSERELFFEKLKYFTDYYRLEIDVYGECGELECPIKQMSSCLNMLERNYYFYFAFENACSEDYVTEKILHALRHYTVPVVLGGANYSRFMPPGSYLNAGELDAEELTKTMSKLIATPRLYHKYFKWHKYYSFHYRNENPSTDDYCNFCAMANDEVLMKRFSVYKKFSSWWSPPGLCNVRGIF